ncbi:hypothetical protein N0V95_007065 [Ascochyta clinopodiicola]|nr:hypothetical protein N0V95_007065 [Ascochyta clinopodiicola]
MPAQSLQAYIRYLTMVNFLIGLTFATVVSSIEVIINSGNIVGHTVSGVDRFLGIPYAQPPINDLRFRPPQALNTSLGIFECPETPPACLQTPQNPVEILNAATETLQGLDNPALFPIEKETEDCLTLDIVRPASNYSARRSTLLPVLFWIHGGGFMNGATQLYPGDKIVKFSMDMGEPILFVAPNYRLGVFGFMPGNEIKAEGSSNAGLKDQRLALHWVHDNIARFGGDPDRVTIV